MGRPRYLMPVRSLDNLQREWAASSEWFRTYIHCNRCREALHVELEKKLSLRLTDLISNLQGRYHTVEPESWLRSFSLPIILVGQSSCSWGIRILNSWANATQSMRNLGFKFIPQEWDAIKLGIWPLEIRTSEKNLAAKKACSELRNFTLDCCLNCWFFYTSVSD